MKLKILQLRADGKTFDEIKEILGCSKSTISYHCSESQKEKNRNRSKNLRKSNPLMEKSHRFKSKKLKDKVTNFQNRNQKQANFSFNELFQIIQSNPICYLTGKTIDLDNPETYSLDHIIPASKGGTNNLDNLGLTCTKANKAKHDLSHEDFIGLCEEVLLHNGYLVTKK